MWNRIQTIALAVSALAFLPAAPAHADDCTLKQVASLDMTDRPSGTILVPLKINGQQRMFLVDTGGIYSSVSESVAEQLHLPTLVIRGAQDYYNSSGQRLDKGVVVDTLTIGNNEAKHIHLLLDPGLTDLQLDGTLAPDLLQLFDVDFDFAHEKLNLFSSDHCPGKVVYWATNYAEIPFSFVALSNFGTNHIKLQVALDGHELSAMLDTGAGTTVLLEPAASKTFGLDANSPKAEKIADPRQIYLYRYQFQSLELNGIAVKHPLVTVMSDAAERSFRSLHTSKMDSDPLYGISLNAPDIILGQDMLRHLHLYIAYKERKLYVTAANAPPPAAAPAPAPQPAGH